MVIYSALSLLFSLNIAISIFQGQYFSKSCLFKWLYIFFYQIGKKQQFLPSILEHLESMILWLLIVLQQISLYPKFYTFLIFPWIHRTRIYGLWHLKLLSFLVNIANTSRKVVSTYIPSTCVWECLVYQTLTTKKRPLSKHNKKTNIAFSMTNWFLIFWIYFLNSRAVKCLWYVCYIFLMNFN